MRCLVTGGGGFLGNRIARMLHERGDSVVVLGRSRYPPLEAAGITCIQGDIRNSADVERACRGMSAVFHVAALAGIWGKRSEYRAVNVDGTRNVIDACRKAGALRLVYTSSPSVVFGRHALCGADETEPYPRRYLAAYPQTKALAEQAVLAANGSTFATVALRPHLIWGPGDPHLIPRILDRAQRGKLVQVGDGSNLVDVTYVDNAAEAHLLACDRLSPGSPCAGRAYFISQGEPVALWPWLAGILASAELPPPTRMVSLRSAYLAGTLLEVAHRALGRSQEPIMTRFLAVQLAKSHYFNISAARRDLGYEPRISTEEGLARLAASL